MLVLSRKLGEAIMIAGNIKITVVEIRGNKVRLGIEAPGDVPVHREEVYLRLQASAAAEGCDKSDTDPAAASCG